jgi:hypothetical protein
MAQVETIEIKGDTSKFQKQIEDLNKRIKELESGVKDVGKAAEETNAKTEEANESINSGLEALDKRTGGAVSAFKGLQGGLKSAIKGFGTLKGAIIATGLGALLILITSLTAAFTSSEEGQDKFAKILGVIGAVTGNLVDLLADLGEKIISVFENPKQALIDFGNLVKDNIINRFTGMLELIPNIGKAIGLLFQGEFKEAGKVAADAVGKVVLGVENVTDKVGDAIEAVKEFGAEQVKEGKLAAQVADMRAKAAKIDRALLVERSEKEAEIAALRLKSRQEEEFSAEERRQAILDAQALEDELLQKEVKALELRRDAQILENTFSRTNIENLDKEAEAIASVNNIQAARLTQQRATQRELNRLNKEIAAEEKARIDEEKKAVDALNKAKEDARLAFLSEQLKLQDEAYKLLLSDQEREVQAVVEKYIKLSALQDLSAEQRIQLTEKENNEIAAIEEKYAKARIDTEQAVSNAKAATINATIDSVQNALGGLFENSKAIATANVLVDAAQAAVGIFKSSTSLAEPAASINRGIQLAALAATSFAAIRKINAATPDQTGGSPLTASAPATPSVTPSFNVVGQSGTNQLATSIGGQMNRPVRAYVVGGDVTSSQELERKRIQTASFG